MAGAERNERVLAVEPVVAEEATPADSPASALEGPVGVGLSRARVLALQRSSGNQTVARMLQHAAATRTLARAPDPGAPAPVIDEPQEDAFVQTDQYSVRITVNAPTNNVQVRVDTGNWNQARQSGGAWWWDWSNFPPGRREIVAKGWNAGGQSTETPVRRAVLTAAPANAVAANYTGADFVALTSCLPRLDGPKTAEVTHLLGPLAPDIQLMLLRALHNAGQAAAAIHGAIRGAASLAGYLPLIPAPVVSALPAEFPAALTGLQLALLTPQQVSAMSMAALRAIDPANLAALQPGQLAGLSDRQVAALLPRVPQALVRHLPVTAGGAAIGPNAVVGALGHAPGVVDLPVDRRPTAAQVGAVGAAGPVPPPAQFSEFTAAHVGAIAQAVVPILTADHVRAIPPAHVGTLQVATFNALRAAATFAALSGEQIRNLSDAQVGLLAANQLTAAQVGALLPVQIPHLHNDRPGEFTDVQLQALAPAQLGALTTAQLNAMPVARFDAFLPEQARWLPAHRLNALTADRFQRLTTAHGASLRAEQHAATPAPVVGGAAPPDLLHAPNIAAFPHADIPEVPVSQLRQLSAPQVQQLTPQQIRALTSDQLAALSAAGVALWGANELAEVAARMKHLTIEQMATLPTQHLLPADFGRLHPEQLHAQTPVAIAAMAQHLTAGQLAGLRPAQVEPALPNLLPAQIPNLTSIQIPAIAPATLQALATLSLQALTETQFGALTSEHIDRLVGNRVNDITIAQFGWLAVRIHSADQLPAHVAAGPPGLVTRTLDPALLAALPPDLAARIPLPALGPPMLGAPPPPPAQSRLETLRALVPDRRGRVLSRADLPGGAPPAGWAALVGALGGEDPAFALDPITNAVAPTAQPHTVAALLTLPPIRVAAAVRDALVAQGFNSLLPWFANAVHNNWHTRLPGPANGPPTVANQHPYLEFDIYPAPNQIGVQGNPAVNAGLTNRGVHRIVVGIQPPAGPHAGVNHAGTGQWFYTADHYNSFVEF